jgi:hypothetical protein
VGPQKAIEQQQQSYKDGGPIGYYAEYPVKDVRVSMPRSGEKNHRAPDADDN